MSWRAVLVPVLFLLLPFGPLAAQDEMGGMPMGDQGNSGASTPGMADAAMMGHPMEGAHIRLTPAWPRTADDQARAAGVVEIARKALARYQDPKAAEADGYRRFAPGIKNQPVYHYTNYRNAFLARSRFNPARPTSLLYAQGPDGSLKLIGAMYTMPAKATPEELDERIPLSVAHWHLHTNVCLPPRDQMTPASFQGPEARFGPKGSITTAEACEAAKGRFFPVLFGWMVHVNMFAGDDPAAIWGGEHHH